MTVGGVKYLESIFLWTSYYDSGIVRACSLTGRRGAGWKCGGALPRWLAPLGISGKALRLGSPSLPRRRKARGTRAATPASVRQPSAFGNGTFERNVPFYQTNPPIAVKTTSRRLAPLVLRSALLVKGLPPIRFCETNPPIFGSKTAFINLRYNGLRGKNLSRNGGFVFQNEPTGRG
jgi:hypothetical protein